MSYNGQNFNSTGSAGFSDNDNFCRGSSNATNDFFDIYDTTNNAGHDLQNHQPAGPSVPSDLWYLRVPQVGGQSQLHTGSGIMGGLSDLSHLNDPTTAPVSLDSGNRVSLDEGKSCSMFRRPLIRVSFIYHIGHNSRQDAEWARIPDPDPFSLFSLDLLPPHPAPVSISVNTARMIRLTRSLRASLHLGLSLPLRSRPLPVLSGQVKTRRGRKDTTLEGRQRGRKTSTKRTMRMAGM